MSYYDDLGVAQNASPEEIREAYRTLVRLFHPDRHTDPALKVSAEAHLRRINQISEVLCNPGRRRRYDAELSGVPERALPLIVPAFPAPPKFRIPFGTLSWMAAAAVSGALIFWLSTQGEHPANHLPDPSPTLKVDSAIQSPNEELDPHSVQSLRQQLRMAKSERDRALAQLSATVPEAPARTFDQESNPPKEFTAITPPAAIPDVPPSPEDTPIAARSRFAGFWAYPQTRNENKDRSLYPPDFIEMKIVEKDGELHGRYRARYRIFDRAISPNVRFEFEGEPEGASGTLPWKGEGGARGRIKLKLLSEYSLEVAWTASDLGHSLALASGTAVLMRRPE